jgi:hypothetical protein
VWPHKQNIKSNRVFIRAAVQQFFGFLVLHFSPYGKLLNYFDLSVAENYIIDCLQKQLLALERDVDQYKHFQPNDPAFKTKAMLQ